MTHSQRPTNRREFLAGKSAIRAIQDVVPGPEPAMASPNVEAQNRAPEMYLVQVGRTAMACEFDIFLNAGQHDESTDAAVSALDLVDELESQLTVYRPVSEVQSINREAGQGPVQVERRLFELLQTAVGLHQATGGAFDITSGPLSKAWGFFRREGRFPSADEIAAAKSRVGSEWLHLDPTEQTVEFRRADLEINLNAIGKGYALDRCAELLASRGVENFLIHGGKSSILARGARTLDESHARGWMVTLKHPFKSDQILADVWLRDRALGTSGSGNQFFHFQGRRYGHILDPRTGLPADQVLSATVVAPNAAHADALSTAFFVMGLEKAREFCESRLDLGVVFVLPGARAGEVDLHAWGFREGELTLHHGAVT